MNKNIKGKRKGMILPLMKYIKGRKGKKERISIPLLREFFFRRSLRYSQI